MNELLDLLVVGLFSVLLWRACHVFFNEEYLSLVTSKYIKGWFSLVVISHHLAQWTTGGYVFHSFSGFGYLAVAIFFFFSGFGLQKRYMTTSHYAQHFLWRRIPPLLLPYLVASLIYIAIQTSYGVHMHMWEMLVPTSSGDTLLPYSWYIFAIIVFYVFFWALMVICKKNYKMLIFGTIFYYIIWIYFCLRLNFGLHWTMSSISLILGVCCAWKESQITRMLRCHYIDVFLGIGFVWVGLQLYRYVLPITLPPLLFFSMNSCVFVALALLFMVKYRLSNKILSFLGNIYLEIYLMQGIFIGMVPMHRSTTLIRNEFAWCILVLIGSVLSGYLLHILCQKPLKIYQQWLKRW